MYPRKQACYNLVAPLSLGDPLHASPTIRGSFFLYSKENPFNCHESILELKEADNIRGMSPCLHDKPFC